MLSCASSLGAFRAVRQTTATRDHVEQIGGGHDSDNAAVIYDRERTRALLAQERGRFSERRVRRDTSRVSAHHVFNSKDTFGFAKFELLGRDEADHAFPAYHDQVMNSRVVQHGPRARDRFAALDRADVGTHHGGDPHHALPSPRHSRGRR